MPTKATKAGPRHAARSARKPRVDGRAGAAAPPAVDHKRAILMAMELMAIPGISGNERAVAEYITARLLAAGASAAAIRHDNAHKKSPLKGEVGNLIFQMPGTVRAPRRLLMAHMDTVPICVGSKPVRKGELVRSTDPTTGLGGDDRAGVAVVLNTALEILERKLPHPPLTFFFPIQEEVGLHGAEYVQVAMLGRPRLAFNWDGSGAEKVTIGATGGYRLRIDVRGLAAHAGAAPERGVSAVAIASLAIAQLVREGWHGPIKKKDQLGTSNVGVIRGGAATNVVTDHVELKAEARSHDKRFRRRIVAAIEKAFRDAAREVRNVDGTCGRVTFDGHTDYEAFCLPHDDPSVVAARRAVRGAGLEPQLAVSNGGLDANWMTANGIPTVTLGCGQMQIHTTSECLDLRAFGHACQIALGLATELT